MESQTEFFHHLPDEVARLIFSRINDYKTLIQCMCVSKSFRQQAVRVPSLLIVCPGSFSSYDERLHRIFSMVKAFKNLKSLVVRVGQPREEPPSWARCMRYAEIGGSVEKFMFMAAKCGDFSELDLALLGLDSVGDKSQRGVSSGSHSAEPFTNIDLDRKGNMERNNGFCDDDGDRGRWDGIGMKERWKVAPDGPLSDAGSKQTHQGKCAIYDRLNSFDVPTKRNPLSQFALRQVIAPSNDVLKRMLPVIHFAIVQGLNELRDSLPAFVAQFSELRTFLLVDMVESITVFMREHHIQELKLSYLQELDELPNLVEEAPKVERHRSQLLMSEDRGKGLLGKNEGEGHAASVSSSGEDFEAVENSRYMNCFQRTEHAIFSNESTSTNMVEPQSTSSKMLPSPMLQRLNTQSLQASKGKEKLAEESGYEREGRFKSFRDVSGSEEGSFSKECLLPPKNGVMSSLSDSLQAKPSVDEPILELYAPSEAFDISKHSMSSDAFAEHVDSMDGKVDCQGEGHGKARVNGYRLQGNKCPKADLANRYSLRRCHKPDSWKKKEYTSLRYLTGFKGAGGLYCNNLPEGDPDLQGSQMHACGNALKKDELTLRDDMAMVGGASDDTSSIPSTRIQGSEGDLCGSIDDSVSSSSEGLSAVEGSQTCEQQTNISIRSSQELQPEAHGGTRERVVYLDSWQERLSRLRDSLRVDPGPEHNQTHRAVQLQPLELEAPQLVEESAVHADSWRHVWQERVRRLRDSLHMDLGQELDRTPENRRERLRDLVVRKRHRAMEKDALSFDYTFWRAEQVASCNYVMSDISMCIATHAARPLRDAEKEVLSQAAIAGPLLVATVSHVNKHYTCHHL